MPEGALKAFGDHGEVGATLAPDGGDCETVLANFIKAGIDIDALAARLQDEGAKSFVKSWNDLMACMTRWAMARMGRRISRSSNSSRCAPFPAWSCSGPATPTRASRPIAMP